VIAKPSTILLPIVVFVIAVGFLAYIGVIGAFIWSNGVYSKHAILPFPSVKWTKLTTAAFWIHLFGSIWLECFFFALLQFIIACTVV